MKQLPTLPASCSLDAEGAEAQGERYRRIGIGAELVESAPREIVVRLDEDVNGNEVEKLIAVERECCPFFEISWDEPERRLAFGVAKDEDGLALDAIAYGLGLEEARRLIAPPG